MNKLTVCLIALVCFGTVTALYKGCGKVVNSLYVIGGTPAALGQYPWMAFIRIFVVFKDKTVGHISCGGSLINDQWIMTAGHCYKNIDYYVDKSQMLDTVTYVALARLNITEMVAEKLFDINAKDLRDINKLDNVYRVEKKIVHEKYNPESDLNDIALLKLTKKVKMGPNVNPVCLDTEKSKPLTNMEVSGWGKTKSSQSEGSQILYRVDVQERNLADCARAHRANTKIQGPEQFCYSSGQKGTCQGDSGGPIVVKRQGNVYYQVGIVSFGNGECEDSKTPNVAVRVSNYVDWIQKHVK